MKGARAEGSTQQWVRRPLSWEMMRGIDRKGGQGWGVGRRVARLELDLSYIMLLRASEMLAEDDGNVHTVYCLGGEGVVFYACERHMEGEDIL